MTFLRVKEINKNTQYALRMTLTQQSPNFLNRFDPFEIIESRAKLGKN